MRRTEFIPFADRPPHLPSTVCKSCLPPYSSLLATLALNLRNPLSLAIIDGRDERAELPIAEVEAQPGDDADHDRHGEHAVVGMHVGRDRTAKVREHEQAAEVTCFGDEVQDEDRQLGDPQRQRGPGGVGFGPPLEEVPGLRDLEDGAGEEEEGQNAREHPAGHDLPLGNRGLRHLHCSRTTWFPCGRVPDERSHRRQSDSLLTGSAIATTHGHGRHGRFDRQARRFSASLRPRNPHAHRQDFTKQLWKKQLRR